MNHYLLTIFDREKKRKQKKPKVSTFSPTFPPAPLDTFPTFFWPFFLYLFCLFCLSTLATHAEPHRSWIRSAHKAQLTKKLFRNTAGFTTRWYALLVTWNTAMRRLLMSWPTFQYWICRGSRCSRVNLGFEVELELHGLELNSLSPQVTSTLRVMCTADCNTSIVLDIISHSPYSLSNVNESPTIFVVFTVLDAPSQFHSLLDKALFIPYRNRCRWPDSD